VHTHKIKFAIEGSHQIESTPLCIYSSGTTKVVWDSSGELEGQPTVRQ